VFRSIAQAQAQIKAVEERCAAEVRSANDKALLQVGRFSRCRCARLTIGCCLNASLD
jgi:hypothetical protein